MFGNVMLCEGYAYFFAELAPYPTPKLPMQLIAMSLSMSSGHFGPDPLFCLAAVMKSRGRQFERGPYVLESTGVICHQAAIGQLPRVGVAFQFLLVGGRGLS